MVAGEIAPSGPLRAWHPNVQKITVSQAEVIWNHYHYGRKFSEAEGKIVYKAPVARESTVPAEFEWNRAIMREMIDAPNLFVL